MGDLFRVRDYRDFVKTRIREMPRGGRGQFKRLADHLGIQTSALSNVLAGHRELNEDQILALCRFFGLSPLEAEYLLSLRSLSKAESAELRKHRQLQLARLRVQAQLSKKEPAARQVHTLSESEKAIFYSSWFYSAIRLAAFLPDCRNRVEISQRLGLPADLVDSVMEFLLSAGLCTEAAGQIRPAITTTQLEPHSPLRSRHHQNWRLKAIDRMPKSGSEEFFFTAPMTISRDDTAKLCKALERVIQEMDGLLKTTKPERLYCLNLDWFEVRD